MELLPKHSNKKRKCNTYFSKIECFDVLSYDDKISTFIPSIKTHFLNDTHNTFLKETPKNQTCLTFE